MKTKLIALLVFALFVSGCSSSDSAPEETTQVEKQSATEPAQENVQEVTEPDSSSNEDGNGDAVNKPAEEPQPKLANSQLEDKIATSLNQWLEENEAPGSAVSVLLPDGSQLNVAACLLYTSPSPRD